MVSRHPLLLSFHHWHSAAVQVASALLRECAAAIERVLLDGGPCRVFIPADADCMQQDIARLRTLFYADGDGLDTKVSYWCTTVLRPSAGIPP